MAYTVTNFKSKKALKDATKHGQRIQRVYQPGPFGPDVADGEAFLEGPHYPEPHRWYASCRVVAGTIVPGSVK